VTPADPAKPPSAADIVTARDEVSAAYQADQSGMAAYRPAVAVGGSASAE